MAALGSRPAQRRIGRGVGKVTYVREAFCWLWLCGEGEKIAGRRVGALSFHCCLASGSRIEARSGAGARSLHYSLFIGPEFESRSPEWMQIASCGLRFVANETRSGRGVSRRIGHTDARLAAACRQTKATNCKPPRLGASETPRREQLDVVGRFGSGAIAPPVRPLRRTRTAATRPPRCQPPRTQPATNL